MHVNINCCPSNEMASSSKCQVHFDDNVIVHPLITWDFASRAARKGPWMQHARDHARFQRRIQSIELVLAPVLLKRRYLQDSDSSYAEEDSLLPLTQT